MQTCHPYIEDIEAIQTHMESWKHLTPDQMKFERLGGLSNRIWKVSSPGSSVFPEALIFRKFNHSAIVDRQKENHILRELAKAGVGAKFYAGNDEYRIEKHYESTELNPAELNTLPTRRHLAKSLSELHAVKLNGLDKRPVFDRVIEDKSVIKLADDKIRKLGIFTPEEKLMLGEVMSLASKEEIEFLKEIAPKGAESVVFSHNDLHSANVLCLAKNQRLLLIDYEYSDYNYRGYDIANVFNESMIQYGHPHYPYYTTDTSRFPCDEDLLDFITYYLFFFKFSISFSERDAFIMDKTKLVDYLIENGNKYDFDQEVQQILEEVRACMLFSHHYWVFWSIVMAKRSDIKFDYVLYAHKRYEMYQEVKSRFFGRKKTHTHHEAPAIQQTHCS